MDICRPLNKPKNKNPGKVLPLTVMGAIQQTSAIYLSIMDGKIVRRFQSPTAQSKERVTKEGKLVHEEIYKGWTGRITNVKTRESDYGKDWQVYLQDEDGTAILSMRYSSGYASAFLKALPNVDLSREVTITPHIKIEGDKKRTGIFLNQDGKSVKWFYTKETTNGLPPLEQIKVKGVATWDDSKMMEFLEQRTADLFNTTSDFEDAPF
jgi:predicted DNA-binding transcriptional regulator AlpA